MNDFLKNVFLFIPRVVWFIPSFIFQNTLGRLIARLVAPAAKLGKPPIEEGLKEEYDKLFQDFNNTDPEKPVVVYIPGNAANLQTPKIRE